MKRTDSICKHKPAQSKISQHADQICSLESLQDYANNLPRATNYTVEDTTGYGYTFGRFFIERDMRFFSLSTPRTYTVTISPTFTTSAGRLTNLSASSEM